MNNFICLTLHDHTPIIINKVHIASICEDGEMGYTIIDLINAKDDEDYWHVIETIPEIMEMLEQ